MTSTALYLNARADWRFTIADLRGADGLPFDLTGFAIAVTFRPDADRTIGIQACSLAAGAIVVTPGGAAAPSATPPLAATGPTIAIVAAAGLRTWMPTRPMLVIGDVMIARPGSPGTEDELQRLAFVALPGT